MTWLLSLLALTLVAALGLRSPAAYAEPSGYGTGGRGGTHGGTAEGWIRETKPTPARVHRAKYTGPNPYVLYAEYVKLREAGKEDAAMRVLKQASIAAGCRRPNLKGCVLAVLPNANPGPSPQQIAQQVIASVGYQSPDIGVAPNHSINHLTTPSGKALDGAVGYPNWFWAVGGTQTDQQVTKTADGMQVSLSIHADSLTVDPGDGNTFTCIGMGTPWTSQVKPGTPSPTCGYTYFKTGTYAVRMTTKWTVHYKITGPGVNAAGNIPIQGWHQRNLAIGELQTVIVH